jgi:hypothetical protein
MTTDFWAPAPDCWRGDTLAILFGGKSIIPQPLHLLRGRCRVVAINRAYQLAPWADMLYGADAAEFWVWCGGEKRLLPGEPDALDFAGDKVTLWSPELDERQRAHLAWCREQGIKVMRHRGDGWHTGLELEQGWVRGNNSGAQVLSSWVPQTGIAKVLLIGLDMIRNDTQDQHWHRAWPRREPHYESRGGERRHPAVIRLNGRDVEIGWYEKPETARAVADWYADHIANGCRPQPQRRQQGMIPRYATYAAMLEQRGVDVVNCNPESAVRCFRFGRLEDELP